MHFSPTGEQRAFAQSLDAMLAASDVPSAARAWAAGDHDPGRGLFAQLAAAGLFAPAVTEAYDGFGPLPVELALAFVELGRHAVPGPVVETVAAAALLARLAGAGHDGPAKRLLPELLAGAPVTVVLPGGGRYALDPDAAGEVLVVSGSGRGVGGGGSGGGAGSEAGCAVLRVAPGHGALRISSDPVRRLALPADGGEILAEGTAVAEAAAWAEELARLLTAAQCLGVGLALLERTVAHARRRTQFGVPIGSFQAVKHRLADTLIGIEFARPLVFGAAVTLAPGDIAAAKVAAGESCWAAARTALQLHGAIGYTDEPDLALWLRKARPLRDAWGAPGWCRGRVVGEAGR